MEFKTQTFTIADLFNWYKADELFLQPKFQRRKVWSPAAKSYLIDTVVRGLPLPKIYYRMQVDPNTVKSVREVVDGQQRLDAIFGFIEGAFIVSRTHNSLVGGKRFQKLPEHVRSQILAYDLSADLLIGADDSQVLQIFARLNSYGITLNAQEKRNARFFGLFKQLAYELGTTHYAFWTRNKILSDQSIARMADAELASELLVALMAGLQDKKAVLDRYYETYENLFPDENAVRAKFERVMTWLTENALEALGGTVFARRALFYSVFVVIADCLSGVEKGLGPLKSLPRNLSVKQKADLKAKLTRLSDGARAKEPPSDLAEFAIAAASQTDNINPRRTRHRFLRAVLNSLQE